MTLKKVKYNVHILQVKKKSFVHSLNKNMLSTEHFNLTLFCSSDHNRYSSFSYKQGNVLFVLHLGRRIVLHPAEAFILPTVMNEVKPKENRLGKCINFF